MAEQVIVNFTGQDDVTPAAKKAENAIKDVGDSAEKSGNKFDGMKEIARGALQSIGRAGATPYTSTFVFAQCCVFNKQLQPAGIFD